MEWFEVFAEALRMEESYHEGHEEREGKIRRTFSGAFSGPSYYQRLFSLHGAKNLFATE
jgi:hypothetical protein